MGCLGWGSASVWGKRCRGVGERDPPRAGGSARRDRGSQLRVLASQLASERFGVGSAALLGEHPDQVELRDPGAIARHRGAEMPFGAGQVVAPEGENRRQVLETWIARETAPRLYQVGLGGPEHARGEPAGYQPEGDFGVVGVRLELAAQLCNL